MKTIFLKKSLPFAAVLVLGASGAFVTTSMQSSKKDVLPKIGYLDGPNGPCSVQVQCDTNPGPFCRANYDPDSPDIARDKDTDCAEVLYRPNN